MKRRTFLASALATLSLNSARKAQSAAFLSRKHARPNILLILSDQERSRGDLPSNLSLPGHDFLEENGVNFTNYYVTTAPCAPSRSTIYTGQHTQHTGVFANPGDEQPSAGLAPGVKTIGHMLRELGYYTAYKGKWHLTYHNFNSTLDLDGFGFSDFQDEKIHGGKGWDGHRLDPLIAKDASNWLLDKSTRISKDKPWFLAVNFINPHDIMYFDVTGQQESKRIHPGFVSKLHQAPNAPPYSTDTDYDLPESYYLDDLKEKPSAQKDHALFLDYMLGETTSYDEAKWKKWQSYYYACIQDADTQLQSVLNALIKSGQYDNTIIIYSSDHGERAGAHGLRLKGPDIYKENLRVPLIIRHPDYSSGFSTSALASGIDIVPTILNFAEQRETNSHETFPELTGIPLNDALTTTSAPTKRSERGILFNYTTIHAWDPEFFKRRLLRTLNKNERPSLDNISLLRGVFDGRYKFARYFRPSEHHQPSNWESLITHNELELYDTVNDPHEITNLAYGSRKNSHRDLILKLNTQLNTLIDIEIGKGQDIGAKYPGPLEAYNL